MVMMTTSGSTSELMNGAGVKVVDSTVPKVPDTSSNGALEVIHLATVTGTKYSEFPS